MLLARMKADYRTQKESKSYAEIAEAKVVDFSWMPGPRTGLEC